MNNLSYDPNEIRRAIKILFLWATLIELRIPNAKDNGRPVGTVSGYFDRDHQEELAQVAEHYSGNAPGIFVTFNPANLDLLARSANRAKHWAKHTTRDNGIVRR